MSEASNAYGGPPPTVAALASLLPAHVAACIRAGLAAASHHETSRPRPQVLRTSTVGNTFSNLGRQLLDGHWVLSFIDADRCAAARDLVDAGQVSARPPFSPNHARSQKPLLVLLLSGHAGMCMSSQAGCSSLDRHARLDMILLPWWCIDELM